MRLAPELQRSVPERLGLRAETSAQPRRLREDRNVGRPAHADASSLRRSAALTSARAGRSVRLVCAVGAVVAALLAGLFAYPAYAWICHPDPQGTRSLLVHGGIGGYSMTASRVSVDVDASGSCVRRFVWNVAAAQPMTVAKGGACSDAVDPLPAVAPDRSAFAGKVAAIEPDGTVSLRAADGTRERTFMLAAGLTAAQVVLQDRRL